MVRDYYIHSSSYIDEPAQVGSGSIIMHFTHIMKQVIIGKNCKIGRCVCIEPGVILGDNVVIENNICLKSGIIIEDNVVCGQSVVFTNFQTLTARSIKPKNSKMAPTLLKTGANIGANSTIICGNTIGAYSLIGVSSVISKNVPDYSFVTGNPSVILGWNCQCGNMISFKKGLATCNHCKSSYQMCNQHVVKLIKNDNKT